MKKGAKIFLSSLFALLSLASVAFLWRNNILLSIILILISVSTLFVWRKKEYVYLYIIAGVLGALAESFAISYGAWAYANPTFLNIPIWLPFLWGEAALFITSLLLEIRQIKK